VCDRRFFVRRIFGRPAGRQGLLASGSGSGPVTSGSGRQIAISAVPAIATADATSAICRPKCSATMPQPQLPSASPR